MEFFNIYFLLYNYLKNFEQIALQSKNNQISSLSQNSDVTTQYSAATLAAASKFKRVLGIVLKLQTINRRCFHNHGEVPHYWGLLLVESAYKHFHIKDTIKTLC